MQFIKHPLTLEITNQDGNNFKKNINRHSILLPNTIRCIISGPSNCGKTNIIMSLLTHIHGLKFENVYVYSKSLYQPKYVQLSKILSGVKGVGYYTFMNNEDVISPDKIKPNSIFIFDDVACEKQSHIRNFFCMGRHKTVDCFYLCQTYTRIPKHLIRDNANLLILFKQDDLNLRHIYNDHVNTDMTFNKFQEVCAVCWNKKKYGFLVVNKDCNIDKGRYRMGFDHFLLL